MSHIPSAAMPHAQAHHPDPKPEPAMPNATDDTTSGTPWVAMAIGGAVALGGALTAAWLLRGDGKPAGRGGKRKGGRGKKADGKRRASRATPQDDA